MRGPYSEYAAPPIYVYPDRPRPGVHFSRTELGQLAVAILALSAAFTILFVRSNPGGFAESRAGFLAMMPRAPSFGGDVIVFYLIRAASVNAFLAGFNMIPVMPLDGAKVWVWNKATYLGIVAIALALIYLTVLQAY